jgi:hypothetical protein
VRIAELLSLTVCVTAGLVLFLEEDHFVAEDFIHVLRLMERTCRVSCDRCNILSLGTYLKTYNYYGDSKKVGKCRLTVSLLMPLSIKFLSFKTCSSLLVRSLIYTPQGDSAYAPVGHSSSGGERNLSLVPMAVTYV